MMTHVTQDPEGTAAGLTITGGVPFAGKTGTAEIDVQNGINQPWFIAFAPTQNPQIAVAATIERCQGCVGAEVAGPVVTQTIDAALAEGGGCSPHRTPSWPHATGLSVASVQAGWLTSGAPRTRC